MRNIIQTVWQTIYIPIVRWHAWASTVSQSKDVTLRDRAGVVEINRKYSTTKWAARSPRIQHDLNAPKINANVYIATRAISDAIKGLPANIVELEMIDGVEREIDNNDHEANEILRNPNTEHAWTDIVDYIVKAYLNDGNGILTIERNTGPNPLIEIWPRDPRTVNINTKTRAYRFGQYTSAQRTYPRNRVIHIRDMDVDDPFWGIGRINTIREEIMMDYLINRFNSKFFLNGATLNLMFTPDHDLGDDQHQQILDAMNTDMAGADNAFQIFINKYAGKFEYPDQKHKDIAFLALLKHNREKIFGVFGLPPFRGNVMEYANYANALAQDRDFWLNTIAPILKVIESAFNKQLLWPLFGQNIRLRFDLNSVPAIKGSQTDLEDRLIKLKKESIVSAAYVREQLNIDEDAAPDVTPTAPAGTPPVDKEKDEQPQKEEQQEINSAMYKLFKSQRDHVITRLQKLTCSGSMMSVLCDPKTQLVKLYEPNLAYHSVCDTLQPILRKLMLERGIAMFEHFGVFSMQHAEIDALIDHQMPFNIESIIDQNKATLHAVLEDADHYNWTYQQLERRIRHIFSYEKAHEAARRVMREFIPKAVYTLRQIRQAQYGGITGLANMLIKHSKTDIDDQHNSLVKEKQ